MKKILMCLMLVLSVSYCYADDYTDVTNNSYELSQIETTVKIPNAGIPNYVFNTPFEKKWGKLVYWDELGYSNDHIVLVFDNDKEVTRVMAQIKNKKDLIIKSISTFKKK